MPVDIVSCLTEESIIESMLPPPPSEQVSTNDRRRRQFYQDVFAAAVMQSSVLLFFLGYRKGEHPHFSLVSCGLAYLAFWAATRYSGRTKFDLSRLSDRHFIGTFLGALISGIFILILSVKLGTNLFLLVALGAVFSIFLTVFILALARSTQSLFRTEPTEMESIQMPVFSLLVYLALIFIYIHNSLYFWQHIVKQGFVLPINLPILSPVVDFVKYTSSNPTELTCIPALDWTDYPSV